MKIAFVPVRGGSKGIPLKNVREFCGVPLLYYTLYQLEQCSDVDKIVVATDHADIGNAVYAFGCHKVEVYWREPANAQDYSPTEDVMEEYFQQTSYTGDTIVVLAQVTNPFFNIMDISSCTGALELLKYDSALTVTKDFRFRWHHRGVPLNYHPNERPRRQEWSGEFYENGALYATRLSSLMRWHTRTSGNTKLVLMPEFTKVELDSYTDWVVAEALMKEERRITIDKVKLRARSVLQDRTSQAEPE